MFRVCLEDELAIDDNSDDQSQDELQNSQEIYPQKIMKDVFGSEDSEDVDELT